MGKEKSAVQNRNNEALQKDALLEPGKKTIKSKTLKKLQNKSKKEVQECDDMGSLIFLKDVTKRKNLKGIDERIELLKNELKSLLGGTKSENNNNFIPDKKNNFNCSEVSNINEISKITSNVLTPNWIKPSEHCNKSDKNTNRNETNDFKPSSSSTPSKFTVWLDKTIDELEKEKCIDVNIGLSSTIQLDSSETPSCIASDNKSNFTNTSLLPQNQVEKLLYKSFVLQNSEIYLSSSEDSVPEVAKSANRIKQKQCRRSRKQCSKFSKEILVQKSLNKCKFNQRGRKRRRINRNPFLSEVVINLDNSSSIKEASESNCYDLDLNNFDWNEPFELDKDSSSHSDVEIINSDSKSHAKLNNQNKNTSEMLENNQSVYCSKNGIAQQKGIWECPVCFEQSRGQEVVATQCGHIFCKICIDNHISKLSKTCPSCRSDLKDKPFITLYNF